MKIVINIALHGDEKIGFKVKNIIDKIPIKKGELIFLVANEKAAEQNKRFIDSDMNRVFPGSKDGDYEQRRAAEILPMIKSADVVIDIHSTTSELKDALIVTKWNDEIKHLVSIINPKYVLYMKHNRETSMIYHSKAGVAFEYGKDDDNEVIGKVADDIKRVLVDLEMIDGELLEKDFKSKCFEIEQVFPKNQGDILDKNVTNYRVVKKGSVVATHKDIEIVAKEDFYPILFGEKNYNDIFGYMGQEISLD